VGETDAASLHAESALGRVRYRSPTWHDYQLFGAAEDAVARHQRKRQRR